MDHQSTMLIVIIVCLIMSAYYSATETAFSTFNRIKMKNLAEKGNKRAASVLKLADNFDTLLSTILIGNNIVNILSASMATLLFGLWLEGAVSADTSATISTLVMTLIVLTFGEITPKTLAKQFPEKFSMFSAPIIKAHVYILLPFSFLFRQLQKLLAKIFKVKDDQGMTEEDLISIIEEAEEDGDIEEKESTLIKNAIEFNELEVSDIFTPRLDITAVDVEVTKEELANVFSETGYSRIPVYEGDLDNILGLVYYKDFFTTSMNKDTHLRDIIKPVLFVTKTQKINDLLKELQQKQMHLAIVTDEYGSVAGLVSLEDIIEEIVGEIWDEHDEVVEEIKEISEKNYIVSGKANVEKLFDELNMDFLNNEEEETDATTVNGWAMDQLGKVPEEGDSFEYMGLMVNVLKMDGRRIDNLHIEDCRKDESEEEEEDDGGKRSHDKEKDKEHSSHAE